MRARQIFEYALVELNKRKAPSLILEDYNYFINKAINQYINRMYNAYEMNQQKTDDIRVLKGSAVLIPQISTEWASSSWLSNCYQVELPDDYLHILNCVIEYDVKRAYKCYPASSKYQQAAKKMTADISAGTVNNFYFKPSYKNPYFYINNITTDSSYPTTSNGELLLADIVEATSFDQNETYAIGDIVYVQESSPSTIKHYYRAILPIPVHTLPGSALMEGETVEVKFSTSHWKYLGTGTQLPKEQYIRYGNPYKVKMEIRYGKDSTIFQPSKVYVDYIKTPQFISLTQDEIDEVEDYSQIIEFPDYVCQEIINELVKLLLENSSDPRLQSHIPINQSIAMPGQGQERTR